MDLPVSKLLLAFLRDSREELLESCASLIRNGEDRNAALASGGLQAIDALWLALHPSERVEQPTDPDWRDPADYKPVMTNG